MNRALVALCLAGWAIGCASAPAPAASPPGAVANQQGRLQITYELDRALMLEDRARHSARDIDELMLQHQLRTTSAVPPTSATILVTLEDPARRAEAEKQIKAEYNDLLVPVACPSSATAATICIGLSPSFVTAIVKAGLENASTVVRARLKEHQLRDATVAVTGEQIVVELPQLVAEQLTSSKALIGRSGLLEFTVVDNDSAYMRRLYAHVGAEGRLGLPTDRVAFMVQIRAVIDQWRPEDGGSMQTDYYLVANDRDGVSGRDTLANYLAQLMRKDPSFRIPDDRVIAFEWVQPVKAGTSPSWRTYFLERDARMTGAMVMSASATVDTWDNSVVLLDFTREGARALSDLSAQIVGKKLAMVLDGVVKSAPIINSQINGGRASIAMGGTDEAQKAHDAADLVLVLKTGSLPAPLREVSQRIVK